MASTKPLKNTDASSSKQRQLDGLALRVRDDGDDQPDPQRGEQDSPIAAARTPRIAEHRDPEHAHEQRDRRDRDQPADSR